ncbi:MAG TPA: TetR/AcrR family transcriptional regulator [Ktedonobacterales bacterium]
MTKSEPIAAVGRARPPTTNTPRQMRSRGGDVRRAEILAATLTVLARAGLTETTTRKIAAEAGVNQAMIGYYFGSKDELLFAALQEMMRITGDIVRASMTAGVSADLALAAAITAFWARVESHYDLQVMQYELTLYALRRPESAWLAREQYAGYSALVAGLAREAFEATHAECAIPFEELARFVIGGLDGLILQFVSDRDTARARSDLKRLIQATLALAGAGPQASGQGASGKAGSHGP